MQVRIIKGTKQVGGCITEISSGKTKIIIDLGMKVDDVARGIDPGNPNIKGLTIGKPLYDALLISHIHEDHIGLIKYVLKGIPIFIEENAKRVYKIISKKKDIPLLSTFNFNKKFKIKDLSITSYQVDHSCYNSGMFLIENNNKKILYTGDFRCHGYLNRKFIANLKKSKDIDLMIWEGTSLGSRHDTYISEKDLSSKLKKEMRKYKQVLAFTTFTNSDRILSFYKARGNKKFYLNEKLKKIYMDSNIKDLDININKKIAVYDKKIDNNFILNVRVKMLDEIKTLKKEGKLNNACLIYSMWRKYLLTRKDIRNFIMEIKKLNIKIIFMQTSGHADKKSLSYVEELVKPKKSVIIHTRHNKKGKDILESYVKVKDNEIIEV